MGRAMLFVPDCNCWRHLDISNESPHLITILFQCNCWWTHLFLHLLQGNEGAGSPHDIANIPPVGKEVSLKQNRSQVGNRNDCPQDEKHVECFKGEELTVDPIHQGAGQVADGGGDAQGRLDCQQPQEEPNQEASSWAVGVGVGSEEGTAELGEEQSIHQLPAEEPEVIDRAGVKSQTGSPCPKHQHGGPHGP